MPDQNAERAMADLQKLAEREVLETLSREELYATVQTFLKIIQRQQINLDHISGAIERYVSERDREKLAKALAETRHKGTA